MTGRAWRALVDTPQSTSNIYEQQLQTAQFLRDFYPPGTSVAANDIGAINALAEIHCLDLWGLGTNEVARDRLTKNYSTARIGELAQARNVELIIAYDGWFIDYGGLPPEWVRVATWKIFNCTVCGGDVVTFYALDKARAARLATNLRAYQTRLPPTVEVNYLFAPPDAVSNK